MRRLGVLTLAAVLLVALAAPAYAGGRHQRHDRHDRHNSGNTTANVLLDVASLVVFNQVMNTFRDNHHWGHRTIIYEQPVVYAAPVVYQPAPVVYAVPSPVVYQAAPMIVASPPPPPPPPQTVYYPHGRQEFNGAQWVWIPNAPAPPPPVAESCQQTGKWVKTPYGFQPECR
ncbi:MAG: hypothetical protein Q8R35_00615 [bacterium]|nr:hypothetical protein [bacterium]